MRARSLQGLEFPGVESDLGKNAALTGGTEGTFHAGSVLLAVLAAGEEPRIALEAERLVGQGSSR